MYHQQYQQFLTKQNINCQSQNMQKAVTDKYTSSNLILKEKQDMGAVLIGDVTSAVDKQVLKSNKIQTIITIGQDSQPQKKQQNIKYLLFIVLDNKSQKISDLFDTVFEEIEAGRKKGGVLIHCYTGISRSSSFVIAYIMRKKFISYDDAKASVKKQRNCIQPNDNFHRQLQGYWKVLQKRQQEQRLRKQKEQNQRRLKQQKQLKEPKQKQIQNQSSVLSSNPSNLSKRTFRGVKGAVKAAFRQNSPANKSIEQTAEKSIQKQVPEPQTKRVLSKQQKSQSIQRKKTEQKKKQVKNVYSNKTKIV